MLVRSLLSHLRAMLRSLSDNSRRATVDFATLSVYYDGMETLIAARTPETNAYFSAIDMVVSRTNALPASMIFTLLDLAKKDGDAYIEAVYRIDHFVFENFRDQGVPFYSILRLLSVETTRRLHEGGRELGVLDSELLDRILMGVTMAVHGRGLVGSDITLEDYETVTAPWRSVTGSVDECDAPTSVVRPKTVSLF